MKAEKVFENSITSKDFDFIGFNTSLEEFGRNPFAMCYNVRSITVDEKNPYLKFEDIHEGYNSVVQGNEVAFFNSLDLLEFAVNKGNFAAAEDVDPTTEVLVRFIKM